MSPISFSKAISPNNVLRRAIFPACDALGLTRATWLTSGAPILRGHTRRARRTTCLTDCVIGAPSTTRTCDLLVRRWISPARETRKNP